jgi:hypothetical protein
MGSCTDWSFKAISSLTCACILIPLASLTMYSIYKGSEAKFAYMLIAFTFGFGIIDLVGYSLIPTCLPYQFYSQTFIDYCWYILFV